MLCSPAREGRWEDTMLNSFSSWLFNVMLWGAVIALVALSYHAFVGPVLTGLNALIGLGVILVISLIWPKY